MRPVRNNLAQVIIFGFTISLTVCNLCKTRNHIMPEPVLGFRHMCLNKVFTKTRFSNHIGKGETGWGTSLQGFLWPRCSRPATPATQQSSIGCSGDWTAHDGCHGAGGERNHLHFSLQPNLGVDDEGLHAQVLLDGLQALDHGVGDLRCPWYTVQLSTDHQHHMGQRNWF